jgi:signal transduction histidine kinase/tetratricopeptide (TPR) repeat protein
MTILVIRARQKALPPLPFADTMGLYLGYTITNNVLPKTTNWLYARKCGWVGALVVFGILCAMPSVGLAQAQDNVDSLHRAAASPVDTVSIQAQIRLGQHYRDLDADSSVWYAALALKRAERLNYLPGIGNGNFILGIAKTRRAQYAEALRHFAKARVAFELYGDKNQVGRVINNQGIANMSMGNYINALKLWYQADSVFAKTKDGVLAAIVRNNLAYAMEKMGAYQQALELQQSSLAYNLEHKTWSTVGINYINIGNIYAALTYDSLALASYDTSIAVLTGVSDQYHIAQASQFKGRLLRRMRRYDEAKASFDTALKLWDKGNFKTDMGQLYLDFSALGQALHKDAEAEAYLLKALAIATGVPDKSLMAECYLRQAELAEARRDWPACALAADNAARNALRIHAKPLLLRAYQLQVQSYSMLQRYAESLNIYRLSRALQDSLNEENSMGRIAQIQISMQLSRKQREIDRLQRAESESKIRAQQRLLFFVGGLLAVALLAVGGMVLQRRRFRRVNLSQLDAISQASPIGLAIVQWPNGQVLYVNEHMAFYYAKQPKDMVGRSYLDLNRNATLGIDLGQAMAAAGGRVKNLEVPGRLKDGTPFWFLLNSEYSEMRGEKVIVMGLLDISQRKYMEQELLQAKEKAEAYVTELQSARNQLLLREKLAFLGEIVAGIAHEINNPIGAIRSQVTALTAILPAVVDALRLQYAALSDPEKKMFDTVLQQAAQQRPVRSTREEREARQKLKQELKAMNVAEADDLARLLIDANISGLDDNVAQLLQSPKAEPLLLLIKNIRANHEGLATIYQSIERTANILQAIKRYAHNTTESAESVAVNVADSINTIIILFSSQIRKIGELELDLAPDAVVWANADKLSQVWTNLITNALHAMPEGRALLRIESKLESGRVAVRITDNGHGIPAEVLPRIFDAFFTTKPQGVGTGMGLPIIKQIVEEAGGTITAASQPGHTTFTVTLPLLPEKTPARG